MKIAVLFARQDSIYKTFPECDVYDIDRDAKKFNGIEPVIAHPPCRAWGRLRAFAKPRLGEKDLALFAIEKVRQNGGVLEHPAHSTLWKAADLPVKGFDNFGGWTLSIYQSWFGHKGQKKTWLYIVGCLPKDIPDLPINFNAIEYTVGGSKAAGHNGKKEMPKADREHTPVELAKWLIELAGKSNLNYV